MYSPTDELAGRQITAGSNQVSQCEILSISIRDGCEFGYAAILEEQAIAATLTVRSLNEF